MKSKVLRVMSLVIAIAVAAALFAACGNTADNQTSTSSSTTAAVPSEATERTASEPTPAADPVKLTWWTFQNHDMDYMKGLVEKFNTENQDGITIEYVVQTSNNFRQALDLAYQANQAPDLFTGQDLANYYVAKGQVEPLDQWITPELKQRYGDKLYSEGDNAVDGKIYSLINTGITYRLVYNKDLFVKAGIAEPPKSLAEMVEDAKKITEAGKADKAYGFAMNLKNTQTSLERSINVIGMMSGFRYFDYKTGQFNFTPYKPIVEAFAQMVADGSMFPGVESLDVDPMRTQFAQGKIGMYMSGAWEPAWYAGQEPPMTINWGAAPAPTIDGTIKGASFISGLRWLYINSKTEYKEQAWKVLKYFYTDEVQVPYFEKGYGIVIVPTVVEKAQPSTVKGLSDFAPTKYDAIYPSVPAERTLKIEGKPFNDIFAAVILGATTFDKDVEELNKKYNDALQAAIKEGKMKEYKIADFDPASLIGK